jgi:hypothetical protein
MKPKECAILFDSHFCSDYYRTSSADSIFRIRYEVSMSQIDHWINSLELELSNDFTNDGQKFKNKLFYHLKKLNWKPTKIKGRWSKIILV